MLDVLNWIEEHPKTSVAIGILATIGFAFISSAVVGAGFRVGFGG